MQVVHCFSPEGFQREAAGEKSCKPGLTFRVSGVQEPDDSAKHRKLQEFLHRLCAHVDDYVSAASGMYAATRAMADEFTDVLESDELREVAEQLRAATTDAGEAAEKRLASFRHRVLAPFLREIQDPEGPRQHLTSQQRLPARGPLGYEAANGDRQQAIHESFAHFVTAQLERSQLALSELSPAARSLVSEAWLQTQAPTIQAQDSETMLGALGTRNTVSPRVPTGNACARTDASDQRSEANCTPKGRSHRAASCPDAFLHFIAQTDSPVDGLGMSPPPGVQDNKQSISADDQPRPKAVSELDLLKDAEPRPKAISELDLLNMLDTANDEVPSVAPVDQQAPLDLFDSMDGRCGPGALFDGLVTAPLPASLASKAPLDADLLMTDCFL